MPDTSKDLIPNDGYRVVEDDNYPVFKLIAPDGRTIATSTHPGALQRYSEFSVDVE